MSNNGGLDCTNPTNEITENLFSSNYAKLGGGAVNVRLNDSRVPYTAITRNRFIANNLKSGSSLTGWRNGSAVYGTFVSGNEFTENGPGAVSAKYISNNIFKSNSSTKIFWNQFFANNLMLNTPLEVAVNEFYSDPKISNNIFTGDEELLTGEGPFFLTINNNYIDESKIGGGIRLEGDTNIFEGVNLGFVNAEEGDYRLTSSSGLIDAGTTDPELAYITDYDYTGTTARVIGASIDIGPYEYDGEAPADSDGDGVNNNIDNCPTVYNEDQADNDSDGEGDVCDSDDDNDGTNDEDDAFPFDDTESLDTDSDGIGNNEDEDDDGDGTLDDSDPQPIIANVFAIDSDGDGVADSIDDYPTDATKQFSSDGDFDGDGFTNDEEVDYCTNPFDKNSQPDVGGLSAWMLYLGTQQEGTQ